MESRAATSPNETPNRYDAPLRLISQVSFWSRQVSGAPSRICRLSEDEIEFHKTKTRIARDVLEKLVTDGSEFDEADGSDGLDPPLAEVPDAHFRRRLLANEVLAATEDYLMDAGQNGAKSSWIARGYRGRKARVHPAVSKALEEVLSARRGPRPRANSTPEVFAIAREVSKGALKKDSVRMNDRDFDKDTSLKSLKKPLRRATILHEEVNQRAKTDGIDIGRKTPLAHEKPVLKGDMGLKCVAHLHEPKWTKLAKAIRESIYDPDYYDDGTYGPLYVRLAIHGAATWDASDRSGGLEGAAIRYDPEYDDLQNKFCRAVLQRQHEVLKVPFPWASCADIQCLCAYVAIECAGGPVIPFTPGRRDVIPRSDLKPSVKKPAGDDFVLLNYRERGDRGSEDEPAVCPASGKAGDCPFLRKKQVHPGRIIGPERGHLGRPSKPVKLEGETKELAEVAKHIRSAFVERIGATEQATVALIAGGHTLGRCHPQISGYAGPWQNNPGYFNNVYCKKLLSEDWKLVDRSMEDCSGDLITGLRPYGMRRQYVNKGGKGDLMMLVSDMALREDPAFGDWVRVYASDLEKLKADFGEAFKWITELGFEPPEQKTGFAKFLFNFRRWRSDSLRWIAKNVCRADKPSREGPVLMPVRPKIGKPYTIAEVSKHSSQEDCWVAVNGKVCDLSGFITQHPGGVGPILAKAGKDATIDWNAIHSKNAIERIAPDVVIGYLVASK